MIKTGKTPITALTFCAIMSISLIVNLPGLAVTPMLGTLQKVFPDTTQFDKQLLTMLPNLLIIPFVLLSGKLSLTRHKIRVVVCALILFALCSVWYMFARSMTELIIISCLLGCGAGMLIPFSTGFIADVFVGKYRVKEMGMQSGLSNATLVAATFAVGWLSHSGNWHMPFAVYLVALIPLALSKWLRGIPAIDLVNPTNPDAPTPAPTAKPAPSEPKASKSGFYVGRIWGLIGVYFAISVLSISISYYCPFLDEKRDWSSSLTGTITAIYFLFIFMPGFLLPWIVRRLKGATFFVSAILMTVGMGLFSFVPEQWAMCVGAALAGAGYGTCQPLLYNKASLAVSNPVKSTLALSFVLTANYLAIVVAPMIFDSLRNAFHIAKGGTFAFQVSFFALIAYTVVCFLFRRNFVFTINSNDY